jgi:hypothetical protein
VAGAERAEQAGLQQCSVCMRIEGLSAQPP